MPDRALLVCDVESTLYDWVQYFVSCFYAMVDETVRITGCGRETLLEDFRHMLQIRPDSVDPFALIETKTILALYPTQTHHERTKILESAFHAFNSQRKRVLRPCLRALVLHHHLVPIHPFVQPGFPHTRPVSITLDATEIIRDAQEAGVGLILHGHQHYPDIVKISRLRGGSNDDSSLLDEDIFICAAGSCGSSELPRHQWNTYTLLELAANRVCCRMRKLDPEDDDAGDVLNVNLPLRLIT